MQSITTAIKEWMEIRANNAIEPGSDLAAFSTPLVGCASGADELFSFLKEDIGSEFYWTPVEAFSRAFPNDSVKASELSVISWVLPQTEHTRLAQRKAQGMPSIEWSRARHYGEKVNENLRRYVVDMFMAKGVQSCAPTLLPEWSRARSPKYGFASSWSERHAAYVCGLGTFGVSDGLITPAGKAVRVGSVIVKKQLTPTERIYKNHNEWCLYYTTGKCMMCARRCPAGAISSAGHDKERCRAYIRDVTARHVEKEQLGFKVNSCGLCQIRVPCEAKNPHAWKQPG